MSFRLVVLLSVMVSGAAALRSQELPSVDQVIEQAGPAKQNARNNPTLLLKGNLESSNAEENGPFEIHIRSPRVAMNLNNGALRSGFDGKELWRQQSGQPAAVLPGALLEAVAIFDPARRFRWKEIFPKIAVVRRQQLGERPVFVLETEPGAQHTLRFFIDARSGDLARAELMPGLSFDMSDYRSVSGWRIPFQIVQTSQSSVYKFLVDKATEADGIDDAVFSKPKPEPQ